MEASLNEGYSISSDIQLLVHSVRSINACNDLISEFICLFQCMDSLYFTVEIMIAGMVIVF